MGCFVVTDDDGLAGLEFYWSPEQFDQEAAEEADDDLDGDNPFDGDDPDDDSFDGGDLDGDDAFDDGFDDDAGEGDDFRPHWRVDYVRIDQLPVSDVELWADEGLPVAGPEAYPVLIRAVGFREHERAEGGRLAYVEGLLRALARHDGRRDRLGNLVAHGGDRGRPGHLSPLDALVDRRNG